MAFPRTWLGIPLIVREPHAGHPDLSQGDTIPYPATATLPSLAVVWLWLRLWLQLWLASQKDFLIKKISPSMFGVTFKI